MPLEELEGRYASPSSAGPGTRYELELHGPRSGRRPGEHFSLVASSWSLSRRTVPGTDQPEVELLGRRVLEGSYRVEGSDVLLEARRSTDVAGNVRGLPHGPPVVRQVAQTLRAELATGAAGALTLFILGDRVRLGRVGP